MNSCFNISNYAIIIILIIIILLTYIWYYVSNNRYNKLLSLIPGPPVKYPLIGNLDVLLSEKSDIFLNGINKSIIKLARKYGDQGIFRLKIGPSQRVFIFREDLVEDLLKDNFNIDKPSEYKLFDEWTGNGLVFNNSSWREMRKLMTPAFHFKLLDRFIPVINKKADILVENLSNMLTDECFDFCPFIVRCAIDIVSETILGYNMNTQQNQNLDYVEAFHCMINSTIERFFKPWLWPKLVYYKTESGKKMLSDLKIIHDYSRKVIDRRIREFTEDKKINEKLLLLDILLDKHLNEKTLTYENVFDEVNMFMAVGHETSSSVISFAIYLIGLYPEVQDRLYREIDSIVCGDEIITKDHINRMVYLGAVLKESMRVYPPAQFIMRKITHETKLGNYTIPRGTTVTLHNGLLCMDPIVFPEPEIFNPDRFLGENSIKNENTFCFVPFSAGPRNCIGQKLGSTQLKIISSKLLLKYRFESIESREELKLINSISLQPLNGIKVKITARN